jgi:hypothetical protein
MSGPCRKNMMISNLKVIYDDERKPLECYGYRDSKTPTCVYINNCRRENGLQAIKPRYIFGNIEVKGRKCSDCDDYGVCYERGGKAAVSRACRFWRLLEVKKGINNG